MVIAQGPTLRPTAVGVLAVEHKLDDAIQRPTNFGIVFLDIQTQQESACHDCGFVVEGAVAIIMLKLLHAPSLTPQRGIERTQLLLACQVLDVVPAPFGMLHANQDMRHLAGLFIVILVARGVIGIEQQMSDGRGAGRLHPHHGAEWCFQFAPLPAPVGTIFPHESTLHTHRVHHILRGTMHGFQYFRACGLSYRYARCGKKNDNTG